MRIEYTGRQIEVTPDLRKYTEERLHKFNRALRDHSSVHVILGASKHRRTAEITLQWRDHTLVGIEETADPLCSINGAIDKLEKQAVRLLQRKWTRKRRPGPTSAIRLNVVETRGAGSHGHEIQATERMPVKPLSIEEAIETIEANSEDLVVFRNTGTDRVNIVYWRRDGRLVLIEPES
ncbi:MAG: ribosome-associated translation inhibitor RaiA [Acidobacteriota bacterium]|nr:ribosome-associated translation inhibitor RaiA [Acidobacteriota bacterium]